MNGIDTDIISVQNSQADGDDLPFGIGNRSGDGLFGYCPVHGRNDLAVNGVDVLKTGIPAGPKVGQVLRWLLEQVINGGLPNDRAVLLEAVRDGGSQEDRSRES